MCERVKISLFARVGKGGAMNILRVEDLQDNENNLGKTIMMDTCHYTFVQSHKLHIPKSETK